MVGYYSSQFMTTRGLPLTNLCYSKRSSIRLSPTSLVDGSTVTTTPPNQTNLPSVYLVDGTSEMTMPFHQRTSYSQSARTSRHMSTKTRPNRGLPGVSGGSSLRLYRRCLSEEQRNIYSRRLRCNSSLCLVSGLPVRSLKVWCPCGYSSLTDTSLYMHTSWCRWRPSLGYPGSSNFKPLNSAWGFNGQQL